MEQLAVGQPFIAGRTRFSEGALFQLERGGALLAVMMGSPTRKEVRDYKKGVVRIGLFPAPPALIIPFKFGDQPWSEATYSPHLVPEDRRPEALAFEEGQGLALQVALVDADTGLVRALRLIGLPTELSQRLIEETQALEAAPWPGRLAYDEHINQLFTSMSSEDIARAAEVWKLKK